jgi:hypothetical protein
MLSATSEFPPLCTLPRAAPLGSHIRDVHLPAGSTLLFDIVRMNWPTRTALTGTEAHNMAAATNPEADRALTRERAKARLARRLSEPRCARVLQALDRTRKNNREFEADTCRGIPAAKSARRCHRQRAGALADKQRDNSEKFMNGNTVWCVRPGAADANQSPSSSPRGAKYLSMSASLTAARVSGFHFGAPSLSMIVARTPS